MIKPTNMKFLGFVTLAVGLAACELTATDSDPGGLITDGVYSRVRHPRYVELGLHVAAVALKTIQSPFVD